MDPNETLRLIRELVQERDEYIWELAQYVEALDQWLSGGGFLPDAWRGPGCPRVCPLCDVGGSARES